MGCWTPVVLRVWSGKGSNRCAKVVAQVNVDARSMVGYLEHCKLLQAPIEADVPKHSSRTEYLSFRCLTSDGQLEYYLGAEYGEVTLGLCGNEQRRPPWCLQYDCLMKQSSRRRWSERSPMVQQL